MKDKTMIRPRSLFALTPAALSLFALAACGESPAAQPDPADIEAARAATKALETDLKAELVAAMSEGGPIAAIDVCNEKAPEIADSVSGETGMETGRTALRLRNPANAPDAFEQRVLKTFAAAIENGRDLSLLEVAEVIETDEGKTFRYMRPIMTGAPCLACHGTAISEEVKTAILARYPDDAATGFAEGEMRGAFTVTKRLAP